jgi:hypothetical protein
MPLMLRTDFVAAAAADVWERPVAAIAAAVAVVVATEASAASGSSIEDKGYSHNHKERTEEVLAAASADRTAAVPAVEETETEARAGLKELEAALVEAAEAERIDMAAIETAIVTEELHPFELASPGEQSWIAAVVAQAVGTTVVEVAVETAAGLSAVLAAVAAAAGWCGQKTGWPVVFDPFAPGFGERKIQRQKLPERAAVVAAVAGAVANMSTIRESS